MVNTELLSSRQSYGIVLGSNIGTTIGSQLFAFDMGEYAAIPMLIGFALMIVFKQEKVKQVGKSILGLGLVYFGLYHIGESVSPLKELPSFTALMLQFVNPLKGALSGAIATLIIQSSSATVGILLSFAKQKLITLPAAVAVILGSEIGTCSDTLIASIGRSRAAIRTGVFHLFFNVTAVVIGLSLFKPFITFVDFISGNSSLARHIANAHMLFNVLSVLLFIAFVPLISMLLDKVIADKLTK
jgi:phosphate:Na+ symporter